MEPYRLKQDDKGQAFVEVPYRGQRLLRHPMFNKGTAFTREERAALALEGLLPDAVSSIEAQVGRVLRNIHRKEDPLERFIGLASLQDRNETLFYRLLVENIEELMPIVYTPTVGKACQEYSHIFRRARGIWITPGHRGRIEEVLGNAPFEDIRLVVVTDNERILGLGDQGAGGMGIPIGKLALYCGAAGIHPAQTLPVSLDVGTDNKALLEDELYLGWRKPRLRGEEYYALVDEFVSAVKYRFPKAILQWEDFKKTNAFHLLDKYRKRITCFNDDIQGTAAVAVAGIFAASRAAGRTLGDERLVIAGAGAAGVGIARLFQSTLRREGLGDEAVRRAVALLDSKGLVVDAPDERRRDLAWTGELASSHGLRAGSPLLDVVRAARPTVLVGVSGVPGLFNEEVVRTMASQVERPVVFPLSNPTSKSEARPADVLAWTDGRALMATGSPFDPVEVGGRMVRIGQGNNAFVFPGVGLGVLVSEAREMTDGMFAAAADALAAQLPEEDLQAGSLFPRIAGLRAVTARVAEAVVRQAVSEGVARNPPEDPAAAIAAAMWDPAYPAIDVA